MEAGLSRLDASVNAMTEYFPGFSHSGLTIGTGPVEVWKGWVRPLQSSEHLEYIFDDIYHERAVVMRAGGRIDHRPECTAAHCHHDWMDKIVTPFTEFKLEVHYGGSATHPTAYVRDPIVPLLRRDKHHLANGAMCPYPAWLGVWHWQKHTVAEFMAHATEWLGNGWCGNRPVYG